MSSRVRSRASARRRSLISASLAALAFVSAISAEPLRADVVIHEIHYAPGDKTRRLEFVELRNTASGPVDLSGWFFSDGIDYEFPNGVTIAGDGYAVVAEDPSALAQAYGAAGAYGPFGGKLSNEGERLVLRDAQGELVDEVEYGIGFPWPTAGGDLDLSIELLDPSLDNSLGGSWRLADRGLDDSSHLVPAESVWRYRAGRAEASSPRSAWRTSVFDDSSWTSGPAPIGYGEEFIATVLSDMQGEYASVFLRIEFEVANPSSVGDLALEARFDDGFNAWVNGVHVVSANMPGADVAYDATASSARENLDFVRFDLPDPSGYLVAGRNVLAVQLHNSGVGDSSDAFFDARLTRSGGPRRGPTPGAANAVATSEVPPIIARVAHQPRQPTANATVRIVVETAPVTGDEVAEVFLEHRVVDPGEYVELHDAAYSTGWTRVDLHDDGAAGDDRADDGVYSVLLPPSLQRHRRLVRYRVTVRSAAGRETRVPYADDPVPNFAYFVYDGVPPWSGAIQPGSSDANRRRIVEHSTAALNEVPVYHLITKRSSTENSTWQSRYGGSDYLWWGTLVYDGEVYDHIRFRARGGVWRYAMGKNMWKFNFWRGHRFRARDNHGREYQTEWDKLNFSACIQQGDFLHRGEHGMFEAAAFELFNLAGTESPLTHWVHFRIVDEQDESGPTQYDGDFWGLYLAVEQMDGAFLDEHGLPDGNLYKMEGGSGELNNQGATGATNRSDLNDFLRTYQSSNPPVAWWRENLSLDRYYGYRSIVEAVHHYDIADGKNYFYYLHPTTGAWSVHAWDVDLTWADNMYGSGNEPFRSRVLAHAELAIEYRNRLREIRDLLYNPAEMARLLEELAAIIDNPALDQTIVDADRAKWDYNPVMADGSIVNLSKAGQGRFYQRAASRTFRGMVDLMKSYVVSRGAFIDNNILTDDAQIPNRPTISATGPGDFPADRLTFRASAFSDPQGNHTFGALEWRLADVTDPDPGVPFVRGRPKPREINAVWESGEIEEPVLDIAIPPEVVGVGRRYRVRVRMRDASGRFSHWSEPLELTTSAPRDPLPQAAGLRVTEVHFHPFGGEDEEFIEIQNIGPVPLDLEHVSIGDAVEFRFKDGDIRELGPGEILLVVGDRRVFERKRPDLAHLIAGDFDGRLDNAGERIVIRWGVDRTIVDFEYDDWYFLTDGLGHSLVIVDPELPVGLLSDQSSWRESDEVGGSPGFVEASGAMGGFQRPGDANQDGRVDLSDAITLLFALFGGGSDIELPCEGEDLGSGGNLLVVDWNGDEDANLTDAIALLSWLFQSGPPHTLGTSCARVEGCGTSCGF